VQLDQLAVDGDRACRNDNTHAIHFACTGPSKGLERLFKRFLRNLQFIDGVQKEGRHFGLRPPPLVELGLFSGTQNRTNFFVRQNGEFKEEGRLTLSQRRFWQA
jgi:hypothetical protein